MKLNDTLELYKEVYAVIYAIEETSEQICYKCYVKRFDNNCTFTKEFGYDKKTKKWCESKSGLFGCKYWEKCAKPTLSSKKTLTMPKNWDINLFTNEEPDRE